MNDNTTKTVLRQLKYLNHTRYEIGIYDRTNDTMLLRSFDRDSIIKSIKFLRYKNMNGEDIFIRPEGESGYIFIDDITITALNKMENDGLKLAIAIESSPQNYQGWLRVSDKPIETHTASIIGRFIARKYGGDMRSSDWRHFGRLAGFTNRKPIYVDELGKYPFVNIYGVSSKLCANPSLLINDALKEDQDQKQAIKRSLKSVIQSNTTDSSCPEEIYSSEIISLKNYWGAKYNSSDADWNAVLKLIGNGFDKEQISQVLFNKSESVAKRSNARADDYVKRTVRRAFHSLEQE